jgi:integration host factor subunit alpha
MAEADAMIRRDPGTLTRADLAESLHREIGLSRAESAGIVEQILAHMCEALSKGQNVKISGFGSFVLRNKGERIGRNPKTGVEVPIAPRRVLTFRASQMLRDKIVRAG